MVVVFDSANPEFYIAHVDILREGEIATDVGPTGLRILPDFIQRLSRLPIITIASIHGQDWLSNMSNKMYMQSYISAAFMIFEYKFLILINNF